MCNHNTNVQKSSQSFHMYTIISRTIYDNMNLRQISQLETCFLSRTTIYLCSTPQDSSQLFSQKLIFISVFPPPGRHVKPVKSTNAVAVRS